ncbi:MAG: hypothetical protein ACOCT9_00985 [archaeon]
MSEKNNEKNLKIDPEVKEELEDTVAEDPFLTEYATPNQSGQKSEKIDVTSEWIGEKDNWQTKTKLSADQIIAMSQVRMLPKAFPELEEIEDILIGTVKNLEQYAVSHGGLSREQQVDVLRAMHGDETPSEGAERAAILQAFSAVNDNEDD